MVQLLLQTHTTQLNPSAPSLLTRIPCGIHLQRNIVARLRNGGPHARDLASSANCESNHRHHSMGQGVLNCSCIWRALRLLLGPGHGPRTVHYKCSNYAVCANRCGVCYARDNRPTSLAGPARWSKAALPVLNVAGPAQYGCHIHTWQQITQSTRIIG